MSPDEVIQRLDKLGIKITRRTLLNYEKMGLIPIPERGGGGPGGRYTDYPVTVIEDAYVAWSLMHGQYGDEAVNETFFIGTPPRIPPYVIAETRKLIKKEQDIDKKDIPDLNVLDNDIDNIFNNLKNKEISEDIENEITRLAQMEANIMMGLIGSFYLFVKLVYRLEIINVRIKLLEESAG